MSTLNEESLFSSVGDDNKKSDGPNEQSTNFEINSFQDDAQTEIDNFISQFIKKETEEETKLKQEVSNLNERIVSFLYEKLDREQDQIFVHKFHEYLESIGMDKERSAFAVNYLDNSYDNSLDLEELKSYFSLYSTSNWRLDIKTHLKMFFDCNLMPSFVDGSVDYKVDYEILYEKLFKFLLSHRLSSEYINEDYLTNRLHVNELRRKFLIERERKSNDISLNNKLICRDKECYTSISVCCSSEKESALTDGKSITYWQTSNQEKCDNHWILINLKENVKLESISLSAVGNRTDDFFKTVVIEVKAICCNNKERVIAKCDYNLTMNNEYTICNCFPSDQNIKTIKIIFKKSSEKNYWGKNNDQIKIRSLKLIGTKSQSTLSKTSVLDASICWYFEMLSSLVLMQSQLSPMLNSNIFKVTKTALQSIPPLSLQLETKNTFLTGNVLDKVESFFKNFLSIAREEEKPDAILVYLAFNLARGNMKSILFSLLKIFENFNLDYDFDDLDLKIDEVSRNSLRKYVYPISAKFLSNLPSNENKTNYKVISSNDPKQEFIVEPSFFNSDKKTGGEKVTCYDMLISIDQIVTISNIKFKLKLESIGINRIILFAICSKETPNLADFHHYNELDLQQLEESKNNCSEEFEMYYFKSSEILLDVCLELSNYNFANFLLIKFIRVGDNVTPETTNLTNFQIFGFNHENFKFYKEFKKIEKMSKSKTNTNSNFYLINKVLWFLCQLVEQHKIMNKLSKDFEDMINFDQLDMYDIWSLFEKTFEIESKLANEERSDLICNIKIPLLMLVFELVSANQINANTCQAKPHQKIFNCLCDIIDMKEYEGADGQSLIVLKRICEEIIKSGLLVFFPTEKERQEFFNAILEKSSIGKEHTANDDAQINVDLTAELMSSISLKQHSKNMILEAFCYFYCQNKTCCSSYFGSRSLMFENESDCRNFINLTRKIFQLSKQIEQSVMKKSCNASLLGALYELTNSIQSNIMYKVKTHLIMFAERYKSKDEEHKSLHNLNKLLINYSNLVLKHCEGLELINSNSFVNKTLFNLVQWLNEIFPHLDLKQCAFLCNQLGAFYKSIGKFKDAFQSQKPLDTEIVLKTWTFDSNTKSSIYDLAIDFAYPLANKFKIEFDAESNLAYEYSDSVTFNFIDSNDKNHAFFGKLGSLTWKEKLEIKSNTFLIFNIRTNKDLKANKSFYLKFTVNAIGFDHILNSTAFSDLNDSLMCLLGKTCARLFTKRFEPIRHHAKANQENEFGAQCTTDKSIDQMYKRRGNEVDEAKSRIFDLNSEYYKILFRGGLNSFQNNDDEGSQSPESDLKDDDAKLLAFLIEVARNSNANQLVQEFLAFYESHLGENKRTKVGGNDVNTLVTSIFCLFIWFNSNINYSEILIGEEKQLNKEPNRNICEALKVAESCRLVILEQNQMHLKNKHEANGSQNVPSFIEKMCEKVDFLLKFQRIPKQVQNVKSSISNYKVRSRANLRQLSIFDTCQALHILMDFLFDSEADDIECLSEIIKEKRENALFTRDSLQLALQTSESLMSGEESLENVLNFLNCFFSSFELESNSVHNRKLFKLSFPYTLKWPSWHHLQNLYSCGMDIEHEIRQAFRDLLIKLMGFLATMQRQEVQVDLTHRIKRLSCFLTNLLEVDWDMFDLELLAELNLLEFFMQNVKENFPIMSMTESGQNMSPIEHLENLFDLSKEKFTTLEQKCKDDQVPLRSREESDSFELSIFPKMYQELFQTMDEGKSFDTDAIIKSLSIEIKTHEQYQKFLVARYMFWKYFQKLKADFFCSSCNFALDNTRYVCLECQNHLLCLPCFKKSVKCEDHATHTDENNNHNKTESKFNNATAHSASHRMLMLEFFCDHCGSTIVGKRINCLECKDFDLCVSCWKSFPIKPLLRIGESTKSIHHSQSHQVVIKEPTIVVAKPVNTTNVQMYSYLRCEMLFTAFTLKLANMMSNVDEQREPIVRSLTNKAMITLINMMASRHLMVKYNSEKHIGLLSMLIRANIDSLSKTTSLKSVPIEPKPDLDSNEFISKEANLDLHTLIEFLLYCLNVNKHIHYDLPEFAILIGTLKVLLGQSDPDKVNLISKELLLSDTLDNKAVYEFDKECCFFHLVLKWIEFLIELNQIELVNMFYGLFVYLATVTKWQSRLNAFMGSMIKLLNSSLGESNLRASRALSKQVMSYFYSMINSYAIISSGNLFEYKCKTRYDGAGILKSNANIKVGLAKQVYVQDKQNTFTVNFCDLHSRRLVCLKAQRQEVDFKNTSNRTNIALNEHLMSDVHVLVRKLVLLGESEELASVDMNKLNCLLQAMPTQNTLLLVAILNLIKENLSSKDKQNECASRIELIDTNLMSFLTKIAFLKSNLNVNWKTSHLKIFLASILSSGILVELLNDETNVEVTQQQQQLSSESHSKLMKSSKSKLCKMTCEKESNKKVRTCDLAKNEELDFDMSSFATFELSNMTNTFCDEDMKSVADLDDNSHNVNNKWNKSKKNNLSLKLFEDCIQKLSKYDQETVSNSFLPCKSNKSMKLMKNIMKTVANAVIIMTCRKLLMLSLHYSLDENRFISNSEHLAKQIYGKTESEFIELLSILKFSENSSRYKLFTKNLIEVFMKCEDNEIISRTIIYLARCMLPELKFMKKVEMATNNHKKNKGFNKLEDSYTFETIQEKCIDFNETLATSVRSKQESKTKETSNSDDSVLFIVCDSNQQSKKPSVPSAFKLDQSSPIGKLKLKKFLSSTTHKSNGLEEEHLIANVNDEPTMNKENDEEDERESVDSFQLTENESDLDELDNEDEKETKEKTKRAEKNCTKAPIINFQIVFKKNETASNSNNSQNEEENEEDNHEDDDDEEEQNEDDDEEDDQDAEWLSCNEDNHCYDEDENDEEANDYDDDQSDRMSDQPVNKRKSNKLNLKLPLDYIKCNMPYLALKNYKQLKWKLLNRNSDSSAYSFKFYSSNSKNFDLCIFWLNEVIDRLDLSVLNNLNEFWTLLIRNFCIQTFDKRLKVLSLINKLLIKLQKSETIKEKSIDLYLLKPIKSFHITLESLRQENKPLNRALFEMFHLAEKLSIKWSIQRQFRAQMKDNEELIEKLCETKYFITLITKSLEEERN